MLNVILLVVAVPTIVILSVYGSIGVDVLPNFLGIGYGGYSSNPLDDITLRVIPNNNLSIFYLGVSCFLILVILYSFGFRIIRVKGSSLQISKSVSERHE